MILSERQSCGFCPDGIDKGYQYVLKNIARKKVKDLKIEIEDVTSMN